MTDFLMTLYPWLLTGHILSFVAWMAALFYLPRLFVYHVEKGRGDAGKEALFQVMERRLLKAIMTPAMIATFVFGLLLIGTGVVDWSSVWPWTKAAAVLAMAGFHGWCAKTRKALAAGQFERSGRHYRMMNEVPTLLLIVIVISVIVRPF
ncbi:hypothetical protein PARPLA_00279 [Rhodobacteraceae bacterium THAF1]|uniref:protoporphyrinogen oxidase HemJ n=1 Tax=Palleronia sp. THAF1 TaxID=2587842 RepID=UPI000F41B2CF|nr:protoporphyrinogen oxidase HemJ [Palleronia sp. THAF1]QFU10156.1 hypothetical protein FIU81_15865 [Palleronia sp. THAF1]VDC16939.1 hypothetical protein PARPLA_00279 [Rhodobacteraceae bacterium THAF1]